MTERMAQVPVSLIERIKETTQALQKMPILQAGSGIPDVTFNLNVVTEHFDAVHAAVADVAALLSQQNQPDRLPGLTPSELRAWRSIDAQQSARPAPLRVEDMAPGTTFESNGKRYVVLTNHIVKAAGQLYEAIRIDPSTIRDVQPPKDAA